MKFTIQRDELERALKRASAIRAPKTLPILSHVRVSAENDAVEFLATDLDITIRAKAPASVTRSGSVCIPAGRLMDLASLLPPGPVSIIADKNAVVITSTEKHRSRLPTMPEDEFPHRPELEGDPIPVTGGLIQSLAHRVAFISQEEASRPYAAGISCVRIAEGARFLSFDGKNTLAKLVAAVPLNLEHLIPSGSVQTAAKLLAPDADVDVRADGERVSFTQPGLCIDSRLLEASFPPTDAFFGADAPNVLSIDLAALIGILRRLSIVCEGESPAVAFNLSPDGNHAARAANRERGYITENFSARYAGEPFKIGLNVRQMIMLLAPFQRAGVEEITLRFIAPQRQFFIECKELGLPVILSMPMMTAAVELVEQEAALAS